MIFQQIDCQKISVVKEALPYWSLLPHAKPSAWATNCSTISSCTACLQMRFSPPLWGFSPPPAVKFQKALSGLLFTSTVKPRPGRKHTKKTQDHAYADPCWTELRHGLLLLLCGFLILFCRFLLLLFEFLLLLCGFLLLLCRLCYYTMGSDVTL